LEFLTRSISTSTSPTMTALQKPWSFKTSDLPHNSVSHMAFARLAVLRSWSGTTGDGDGGWHVAWISTLCGLRQRSIKQSSFVQRILTCFFCTSRLAKESNMMLLGA
jgi:hypothetical protein